jgi:hypothetical protein
MSIYRSLTLAAGILSALGGAGPSFAQTPADSSATDSAASTAPAHHGGLVGKVKKVAGSHVVQTVAKTAACTVVPGGQLVAGAIDAAASSSASGTAQGAAEAATGTGCANTMGQLTGAGDRAAQQALTPTPPPGQPMMDPRAQAGLNMMNQMGIGVATDEESQARCLGVSVEEYRLIVYPPGMNGRPPTKAEEAARTAAMKKLDPKKQQECSMQQSSQMMEMAQQMTTEMQDRMAQDNSGTMTEAPGRVVALPSDLASALKSGTVVVRDIDWVAGTADVSAAARPGFDGALTQLGAALRDAGGNYRIDLYFMDRYADDAASGLAPGRVSAIEAELEAGGEDGAHLSAGKTKRDHDPRVEIVRTR